MSFGNQHTAALNLTFIRRNTRFAAFFSFALKRYLQVEEVWLLILKASTGKIISTAGLFLKLDPLCSQNFTLKFAFRKRQY